MSTHVLQLGPYPPPEGGITRNVVSIRERLIERGDRCTIIATSKSGRIDDEPNVHHPRSATDLLSLIRKIDHDILHLHVGGDITRRLLSLMVAAATLGKRPILSFHSGGYPKTANAQKAKPNSARGHIFRRFSRIIAINEELARMFGRYGVEQEKISIIPPFALTPARPDVALPHEISAFAESHGPLLVSVGGLEADYEPIFLVEAMSSILDRYPRAGLIIVGGGSMRDPVESAVAASGHAEAIRLSGNLEHEATLNLIARADALLRITLFDGDAISVREALFVGTPVIATDTAQRPDGVRLVAAGDLDGLVKRIDEAVASAPVRPIELVPDHSNIKRVLTLYDELLSGVHR